MAHVSLRVSDQEKAIMENYAQLHGISLSDVLRDVFFEKLEDEYDLKSIAEYEANPSTKLYSHDEVGRMLGIK